MQRPQARRNAHTEEGAGDQYGQSVGSYRDGSEEVCRVLLRAKDGGTYDLVLKNTI